MWPTQPTRDATRSSTTIYMAAPQQQEDLFREGRVELGIRAYKLGQITTLRGVKRAYNAPRNTIKQRISGIKSKRDSIPPNPLLTPV